MSIYRYIYIYISQKQNKICSVDMKKYIKNLFCRITSLWYPEGSFPFLLHLLETGIILITVLYLITIMLLYFSFIFTYEISFTVLHKNC